MMKAVKPLVLALMAALTSHSARAADAALVERGAYLARIMDCAGCHMPRDKTGAPVVEAGLSGGNVGFELPGTGIFWPPNLTPSPAGLGEWSDDEIEQALRHGVSRDGRALVPVMPWMGYSVMTEADMAALIAYLRSMPAVDTPNLAAVTEASAAQAPFYRVTFPGQ